MTNSEIYKNLEVLVRLSQNEDFQRACILDGSLKKTLNNLIKKQADSLVEDIPTNEQLGEEIENKNKELGIQSDFVSKFQKLINDAEDEEAQEKRNKIKNYLDQEIDELDLSVRAYNCLKRVRIDTIKKLCELHPLDIENIRNLGSRGAQEVINKRKEILEKIENLYDM